MYQFCDVGSVFVANIGLEEHDGGVLSPQPTAPSNPVYKTSLFDICTLTDTQKPAFPFENKSSTALGSSPVSAFPSRGQRMSIVAVR